MMNDEVVVKVLQESQDAVRKCIGMLELEQGFGPITNVYIANYKLLLDEMHNAIQYLEDETRTTCKECGGELTLYCQECAKDTEKGWTNCDQWRLPE